MERLRQINITALFFECFKRIAAQPLLYQAVEDIREGYRRSVCGVDSIYYRVDGDTVEIMSILGQQDVDEWLVCVFASNIAQSLHAGSDPSKCGSEQYCQAV